MNGVSIEQLAPNLIKLLKPARKYASVATALQQNEWARAVLGASPKFHGAAGPVGHYRMERDDTSQTYL
jgi:hypothetical protein